MNRLLLSTSDQFDIDNCTCIEDPYESLSQEVAHHDADGAFTHVYFVMLFVASLWFVGKASTKLGMPALVGEMLFGMLMGPNLLNLVGTHGSEFLIVIGEIGLIMLVVEAGIDVDIGMLKLIGPRGVAVAILGSIIPMGMGLAISMLFGQDIAASIAIGACFAPTSMGIALNVLKKAKILNTPTGQLIIAAAILDDVIALIILSELSAMKHPSIKNILLPLIVSPVLILVIGYLAVTYIPKLIKKIMAKIPESHHENGILALLFVSTFVLIPACHFVGSSHLLGGFLSGLMFCTDHTIHHVWTHQIKRILYWMLRIFFACTIGFAIPVKEFTSPSVIMRGVVYCSCILGKIVTGAFARPLNKKEFLIVGFSMSARGEFASILATASFLEGTINKEYYSAILLSVLLTAVLAPYLLSFTIKFFEKQVQKQMDKQLAKYENENLHPVYFAINTKARGQWGHQGKLLHGIFQLSLEIIDFRSWHAPEYNHSHHKPLTMESFYVMDGNILLPPTKHLDAEEKQKLKNKVAFIKAALTLALGDKAAVTCKRWLPGVLEREDTINVANGVGAGREVMIQKLATRRTSYCRREAFKQAHAIMSSMDLMHLASVEQKEQNLVDSNSVLPRYRPSIGNAAAVPDKLQKVPETFRMQPEKIVVKPAPMQRTQSDGVPRIGNVARPALISKHISMPDYHSGMGHGGQAGGAGALPVHNRMINIHDYWGEQIARGVSRSEEDVFKLEEDDSVSVIYGDEDAQHHKLPFYQTGRPSASSNLAAHKELEQQIAFYINNPGGAGGDSPITPIVEQLDLEVIDKKKVASLNVTSVTNFGSYPDVVDGYQQFATPIATPTKEFGSPTNDDDNVVISVKEDKNSMFSE